MGSKVFCLYEGCGKAGEQERKQEHVGVWGKGEMFWIPLVQLAPFELAPPPRPLSIPENDRQRLSMVESDSKVLKLLPRQIDQGAKPACVLPCFLLLAHATRRSCTTPQLSLSTEAGSRPLCCNF